eukprot:TRINITY_DN6851_c0_g1_i1.p1 TRINITY_DN6851_c0_g1~~TRINITY_DN6851_c0_g1_i1.p1  ORF type:complete len:212 (+),score=49.74 TRINITY_DN6851_c0_g1_i1:63-638(+)
MPLAAAVGAAAAAVLLPRADTVLVCIADRDASPDLLGAGLSFACSKGGVDCSKINTGGSNYYPNNIYAHCDWAFDQFYQADPKPANCDFNGAATLVNCSTACTKCQATDKATEAELTSDMTYLCGSNGVLLSSSGVLGDRCDAIKPNGSAYKPNTLRDHVNWALNTYYQVYRCAQPDTACNFNGTAAVVPC